jgi:HEAT repeat protein
MEMLRKVKHDRIKEGVARALTVKEARPIAVPVLIAEFQSASDENDSQRVTKWTIGNALSVVADDSAYEPIVALLRDKKHGSARDGLATALCNMKKHREQAVRHLIQLLDDADVRVTAMMALGKLRVKAARSRVESFLEDPDPWVRREAKQALAKIDKAR